MKIEGKNGTVSMPWWAWGTLTAVLFSLLFGTATGANWITSSVITHKTKIELHDEQLSRHEKQLDRIDAKLDKILEKLSEGS